MLDPTPPWWAHCHSLRGFQDAGGREQLPVCFVLGPLGSVWTHGGPPCATSASAGIVGTPPALLSPSLRMLDPIQWPSMGTCLSSGKILYSLLLVDKNPCGLFELLWENGSQKSLANMNQPEHLLHVTSGSLPLHSQSVGVEWGCRCLGL